MTQQNALGKRHGSRGENHTGRIIGNHLRLQPTDMSQRLLRTFIFREIPRLRPCSLLPPAHWYKMPDLRYFMSYLFYDIPIQNVLVSGSVIQHLHIGIIQYPFDFILLVAGIDKNRHCPNLRQCQKCNNPVGAVGAPDTHMGPSGYLQFIHPSR